MATSMEELLHKTLQQKAPLTRRDALALPADKLLMPPAYRYERKFVQSGWSTARLDMLVRLNPACFRPIYQGRWINNIYFDTPDRAFYRAAMAGEKNRTKIRIRWYGASVLPLRNPVLEFKVKAGVVGYKRQYQLPDFDAQNMNSRSDWQLLWEAADLSPVVAEQLKGIEPALMNRYYRTYQLSADRRFRITIDSELGYGRLGSVDMPLRERGKTIIELKYSVDAAPDAAAITSAFPFRLRRSSKYATGLAMIGG